MNPGTLTSYDRVPYSNNAFRETHPARLRAAGILFGLESPLVETCRVLELGCGGGGNLAPLAYAYPAARFIGIDLSERQIREAADFARGVGLSNVEFRHLSILDVDASFGPFDYILCHGVFSWVPHEVQEKILVICRDHLAPAGIAFISFNTYPGSYARRAAREMMLYHTAGIEDERQRVRAARELLESLADSSAAMKGQWDLVRSKHDSYVLHEYLEECNEPLYFHQFMQRAERHGLQYVADAMINSSAPEEAEERSRKLLAQAGENLIQREQYLDFLRNQSFRRALLCHASARLDRAGAVSRVPRLRVASPLRREGPVDLPGPGMMQFAHPGGGYVQSDVPLVKSALVQLEASFPQSIEFDALCQRARAAARVAEADLARQRQQLAQELLEDWLADLVDLYADPDPFTTTIGQKPQVSALARRQAQLGGRITTLRHEMVEMDDEYRKLIQWIDGTRNEPALARKLLEEGFPAGGSSKDQRAAAEQVIRQVLDQLARQALLRA